MTTRPACHIARLVLRIIPASHRDWARAMAGEVACIKDDGEALAFAFGCLRVGCMLALAGWIGGALAEAREWVAPRLLGLGCALAATLAGCGGMLALGMPGRYPAVQLLSLLIGLSVLPLLARTRLPAGAFIFCAGGAIALTALFGLSSGGVARWAAFGPLRLQPSLILLPAMLVLFARDRSMAAGLGIALAAGGVALQADPILAGALLAGLLPLLARIPSLRHLMLAVLAAGCWALALHQPSNTAEGVIAMAFAASGMLGVLLCGAMCLLPAPALAGLKRPAHLVFGAFWIVLCAGSLTGLSVTPLLGFGGSAVLGYLFSVAALDAGKPSPHPEPQ